MPRIPGTRVKDGRAINVSNGIMRASSRNSLEKLEPIEPGNADAYAFDSGATSNLLLSGTKSGSKYPAATFRTTTAISIPVIHWGRTPR